MTRLRWLWTQLYLTSRENLFQKLISSSSWIRLDWREKLKVVWKGVSSVAVKKCLKVMVKNLNKLTRLINFICYQSHLNLVNSRHWWVDKGQIYMISSILLLVHYDFTTTSLRLEKFAACYKQMASRMASRLAPASWCLQFFAGRTTYIWSSLIFS